jgi:2,4-dichlorophenol 6-monooxygenase
LSGQAWRAAVTKLGAAWLRLVVVGEEGARDPYCHWPDVSEIEEAGAILVRPDGYVAWRHRQPVWDAAEANLLLRGALGRVLDRPEL